MSDTGLRQVLENLHGRLAESAATATAEETAYLATAVEKISGKLSALDLLKESESHQSALEALSESIKADMAQLKADYAAQHALAMTTFKDYSQDTADTIFANFEGQVNQQIADANADLQLNLNQFEENITNAVSSLQNAVADSSSMGEATHARIYFYTKS